MDKRSNAANHNLCHFSYADGRRCRMLRHRDHPGLCPFHSREERQRLESERIGTELAASLTGHYLTASDINHVLGKVFTALAQDRISIKKAKALAYVAQLMLHSLRYAKQESQIRYSHDAWLRMLQNATNLPDPLDPIEDDFVADDNAHAASDSSPCSGDFASPSETVGAAGPEERGKNTSPSPTAAGSASLGVGASACPEPRRAPTHKPTQSARLTSPLYPDAGRAPSAPSADACGDSSHRAPNNDTTNDYTDEDNTEEPALVFADHRPFLHLR